VRVHYKTSDLVHTPSLVARIIRSEGTTCCEIRTRNYNIWLPDLDNYGFFSFTLNPLQLASGIYMVEIRIQDTADTFPLAVGQSVWFQVSSPGVTVAYEYGGVFVPQVIWELAPNQKKLDRVGNLIDRGANE